MNTIADNIKLTTKSETEILIGTSRIVTFILYVTGHERHNLKKYCISHERLAQKEMLYFDNEGDQARSLNGIINALVSEANRK